MIEIKNKTIKIIISVLLVCFGTGLAAFGTAVFVIPFDLIVGGVSGIAIVISKLLGGFSTDVIISIIMWSLFVLGYFVLGKKFALKTLISVILFPLLVSVFSRAVNLRILNGFFNIAEGPFGSISPLIASLFSGLLIGTGCALTFLGGGSTGGIDILALIICKYIKNAKTAAVIFIIDALTIVAGTFILKNLSVTLLGIISAFIWSTVVDKVLLGNTRAFNAQIITTKGKQINSLIIKQLGRTATFIKVTGGFSGKEMDMLNVSFAANEYRKFLEIVLSTDKQAFITVQNTHQIHGTGWIK